MAMDERLARIMIQAARIAESKNHGEILVEHILSAILSDNKFHAILGKYGVDISGILKDLASFYEHHTFKKLSSTATDVEGSEILTDFIATYYACHLCNKNAFDNEEDLFYVNIIATFLFVGHTQSQFILFKNGVTQEVLARIYDEFSSVDMAEKVANAVQSFKKTDEFVAEQLGIIPPKNSENPMPNFPFISSYTVDYLKQYIEKNIKFIGRKDELLTAQQILLRKNKPNLMILGESGIGKTIFVNELSKQIKEKNPHMVFYQLDIGALTSKIMLKGELETRIRTLFNEMNKINGCVLFIDNIHRIQSTGDTSLQGEVSNGLKPMLESSKIRIIGVTTQDDYKKSLDKDDMMSKYFFNLVLSEPSIKETEEIMEAEKPLYEKYFGCQYTKAIMDSILNTTGRFIHEKRYPEKALDIMDMVGATTKYNGEKMVKEETIYKTISALLRVPLENISQKESDLYKTMDEKLREEIIGQDKAIQKVCDSIIVSRSGLRESNKTAISLFFRGQSGCGKTEICRVLANVLNIPLVRFDMSEYMEEHSVSKFLGSPPGYKGFGDGKSGNGLLINAISDNPHCILLLDEIEKANPKVHNLLLQIMDNGKITSSAGKSVSFEHVFLIMTSNVGSNISMKTRIGFGVGNDNSPSEEVFNESFMPEFRSRIDETVVFNALTDEIMERITYKFLNQLQKLLKEKNIDLNFDENVVEYITKKATDINNGARPIKHIITNEIKNVIAKDIVFGKYENGGEISITENDGKIIFGE